MATRLQIWSYDEEKKGFLIGADQKKRKSNQKDKTMAKKLKNPEEVDLMVSRCLKIPLGVRNNKS